jgi:hypothetical protein
MSILVVGIILLSAILANATAQPLTDPTGDLLDSDGKPAVGESYLDIIESSLSQDSNNFVGTIKLNGNVPSKTSDPSVFIEWSLMIDSDRNPSTHPWGLGVEGLYSWPLTTNDIGVDYMVELCADDSGPWSRIFDGPRDSNRGGNAKVQGNTITLVFSPSDIGGSTNFDYVVLVRKYGQGGAPEALEIFDKAPNSGHYSFRATVGATQTATTSALSEQGLPSVPMEFAHATVYYNEGNQGRAKNIGEAFEYAYDHLQEDFPYAPSKFRIYIYRTQDDLLRGLVAFSGFSPGDADYFKNGGAPRPLSYVMHVNPSFDWTTVTHELTHTFIEEYSGKAYRSIKWLDEGLADREGWKIVLENVAHRQEATDFKQYRWEKYVELKSSTQGLYPLGALTTETQWSALYAHESQYSYAEGFVVVSYLISTFGQDRVLEILKRVQAGESASYAVKDILGKNETEILDAVKKAPQSVIFQVITTTTSPGTTTARVESSTMTSTVSVTTTRQVLTTATLESVTTQESLVTAQSTQQGTSTLPSTELILLGAVIAAVAAVAVIVTRSRKKAAPSLNSSLGAFD